MAIFELKSGINNVTIPIDTSEAYIIKGEAGPFWGTITVDTNTTTPLKMFIDNLEFGTATDSGYIDFGSNNTNDNELWFSGINSITNPPDSNDDLSLVTDIVSPKIYKTITDGNGTIYFYADNGTYSFESAKVH